MQSAAAQSEASEEEVRSALAQGLAIHGARVVTNLPGSLVMETGSKGKTMLFGVMTRTMTWPVRIHVSTSGSKAGTGVHVSVTSSAFDPLHVMDLVGKSKKPELAWLQMALQAIPKASVSRLMPEVLPIAGAPAPPPSPFPPGPPSAPRIVPPAQVPGTAAPTQSELKPCTNCGAILPDQAKFCPECGQPAPKPLTCPSCGSLTGVAKFCSNCGQDLSKPGSSTEAALGGKEAGKEGEGSSSTATGVG